MCSEPAGNDQRREGTEALVRDAHGRLLLVRRADDGRWAMPGGWVDPCETPERAVVREVAEDDRAAGLGTAATAHKAAAGERPPHLRM